MKSLLSVEAKKQKYPYIAKTNANDGTDFAVLFTGVDEGMVIWGDLTPTWPVGHYSNVWTENTFEPFTGKITLSND